jgi:hypothetical protein
MIGEKSNMIYKIEVDNYRRPFKKGSLMGLSSI